MTEKEIREWLDDVNNSQDSIGNFLVAFARHVGALKEPVVKYQYIWKLKGNKIWTHTTPSISEKEFLEKWKSDDYEFERIESTRTEE
jgi:hypothetical protein